MPFTAGRDKGFAPAQCNANLHTCPVPYVPP